MIVATRSGTTVVVVVLVVVLDSAGPCSLGVLMVLLLFVDVVVVSVASVAPVVSDTIAPSDGSLLSSFLMPSSFLTLRWVRSSSGVDTLPVSVVSSLSFLA